MELTPYWLVTWRNRSVEAARGFEAVAISLPPHVQAWIAPADFADFVGRQVQAGGVDPAS